MTTEATILIVDDNTLLRETLQSLIQITQPTWQVITASDGAEGVRLARASQPTLILLDLHMPGMNGYEAALQLQADPATRATPLVLMTSEDCDDPLVVRLRTLCHGFLSKPFSFREIKHTLDRLLQSQSAVQPFPARTAFESSLF
ncbi:MAG TPA: response regulator [Caldilineaceae bacterium]|nr:response regulator [Caldilineaceae bacterium]